ncbi:hypothetical protein [Nakamurella endophytica]|uniref:hypothetical protein n=1 Tax=Nakamurella endophytica TaxID=1748367 RepID=UPI001663C63F|nr:hypothetical protein [Nakamurella endophytica]
MSVVPLALARLALLAGDVDAARAHLARARTLAVEGGSPGTLLRCRLLAVQLAPAGDTGDTGGSGGPGTAPGSGPGTSGPAGADGGAHDGAAGPRDELAAVAAEARRRGLRGVAREADALQAGRRRAG